MAENETEPGDKPSESPAAVREEAGYHGQESQGVERRVHARYIAHWRAALVNPSNGDIRYLGKTDNISLGGAALICEVNVPAKQDYHVYLEIPQANGKAPMVIEMLGRVAYSNLAKNAFRVGVSFKQFHGDAEAILKSILASGKLRQLYDPDND